MISWDRTHLSHSQGPIFLHETDQDISSAPHCKPCGFWYEVDGDWRRWCEAEDFARGRFLHRVDLKDCQVLKIDTLYALDRFHDEFYKESGNRYTGAIDWKQVATRFDGVEIAPYRHERRLELNFMWYYGWDCASGVIWRPKGAVVEFEADLSPVEEKT